MVVLYSTHCPKCNVITQKLKLAGIDFVEKNDLDEMIALGFMESPVLVVDDKPMGFMDALNWIKNKG